MGLINYKDVEYTCRSLNDGERKLWDEAVRRAAKVIWKPAEEYWNSLGNIPEGAKNYCLAEYLKTLDWEAPPKRCRIAALNAFLVKEVMAIMCPEFPLGEITDETYLDVLALLNPYFIEVRSNG
jgi:hypothetical protein